jgi:superfamily II DNA or RNA helicase
MRMRDYQREAVEAVLNGPAQGESDCPLVVLPTGCGKTVVFSEVIRRVVAAKPGGRAMVVAHREELINQAADKIHGIVGVKPEIEMAQMKADQHHFFRSPVVVGSVQSLHPKRLARFNPDEFAVLVIDEAHHATSDSYVRIVEWAKRNPRMLILGVTATPDRTDRSALGQVFNRVAYTYEITDAIRGGYLVPIVQRKVDVHGLDYSNVRTTAGDLNARDLSEVMNKEEILQQIVSASVREAKWRKAVVFAPPGFKGEGDAAFRISERMVEIFNRYSPGSARLVWQGTSQEERRQNLRDFKSAGFQFLVNVGVFTEGFDESSIDMVIVARATKSRSLYAQMIGRGTRPHDAAIDSCATAEERRALIARSVKPNLEVLDFKGNAGRHALVTVADILGGRYTREEIEAAEKETSKGAADVLEALDKAKVDGERKAAAARNHIKAASVTYKVSSVDPFNALSVEPERENERVMGVPATEKQIACLERNGVPLPPNLTRRNAARLIDDIITRREQGLCTAKQALVLARYGMNTRMTFDEARSALDQLAQQGWKRATSRAVAGVNV